MFDKKGQIRIIESFLAVTVIFSAVLVSVTFPTIPDFSKEKSLTKIGLQVLTELDVNGTLGNLILQHDWTSLKTLMDILLPLGVSFNLTVYDRAGQMVNSEAIRNSNLLGPKVVSVQRLCATKSRTVEFFVVQLQLAWTS